MANIKRNKGIKGPTIAICSIATVALVGVGFASWVISGSSSVSESGSITVDVVSDSTYPMILGDWEDGKKDIVFGVPSETDASSMNHASWLTISHDENSDENLVVTLNFNIYNVKENDDLSQILSVDFDLTNNSGSFDEITSVTNKYVSGLPTKDNGRLFISYKAGGSSGSYTEISGTATVSSSDIQNATDGNGDYVACQATAKFEWGEAFGGMNPYEYSYLIEQAESAGTSVSVGGGSSETLIQSQLAFSQALQQLEADFGNDGVAFTMTLTSTAPATGGGN